MAKWIYASGKEFNEKEWWKATGPETFFCSSCGASALMYAYTGEYKASKFCPACGEKMDNAVSQSTWLPLREKMARWG